MFDALLAQVQPNKDALSARLRAPLEEQFAREVEQASFFDHRFASTFSYQHFSSSIKRFGFGGLTHLNPKHMQACFANVDSPDQAQKMAQSRAFYFSEPPCESASSSENSEGVSVVYLLRLAMLLCEHESQAAQLQEMWLLINPALDDRISGGNFFALLETLAEIAVERTCDRIESLGQLANAALEAQRTISLRYMATAKVMKQEFLDNFRNGLPSEMSFCEFAEIAQAVCMNSSQLRMRITQTPEMRTSQDVVISQVSTIIISFLTHVEQVGKAQLVCRKWYRKFVPLVMQKIQFNFTPWQQRRFRLVYENNGREGPLYLALVTDKESDKREKCGRTYFISAGSSDHYQQFSWTIEQDGTLKAANNSQVCLAAHRTFTNDTLGKDGTFVISTIYKGHENQWKLERVGDLDRQRYLLVMANSKCIKDHVNHCGWAMTADVPPTGTPNCKMVERNETSRYVYIKRPLELRRTLTKLPVWRLELIKE